MAKCKCDRGFFDFSFLDMFFFLCIITFILTQCSSDFRKDCPHGTLECVGWQLGSDYKIFKNGFDRGMNPPKPAEGK